MHCWETRIYNTSAELPSAGKMLHYHGNTRGLLLHRRLGNLYRAYDVTYTSGQHCGRLYVVHYVLIKVWLCPSVLYVLPVLIKTYEIWGLFPPECPLFVVVSLFLLPEGKDIFHHVCTFPHVHSRGFRNLTQGICWHLWIFTLEVSVIRSDGADNIKADVWLLTVFS